MEKPAIASSYKSTTTEESGEDASENARVRRRKRDQEKKPGLRVINPDKRSRNNTDNDIHGSTSPTSTELSISPSTTSESSQEDFRENTTACRDVQNVEESGTLKDFKSIKGRKEKEHEREQEGEEESYQRAGAVNVSTPVVCCSEVESLRSVVGSVHGGHRDRVSNLPTRSGELQRRGAVRVPCPVPLA
jgi:hypothetical protein